jgi:O-antigen/teichoic acid export membrane protein
MDMGAVGVSLYVTRALYLVRGLVTARFLGPSDYGVWGTLGILLNYSNLAPLGSAEAVAREVPLHMERGEPARARDVVEQSFSFNLYASLLATLAILVYAHLRRASLEPIFFTGLHVAAAGITLQQLYFFYRIVLRAQRRFFFQSKVDILLALVNVPVTIGFVALWGLRGLYASYVLVYVWIIGYLLWNVPIRLRGRLDLPLIVELIRIGFPVYLLGLVYTLFMSVDRMVIAKFLTPADMGYYTIAYTVIGTLGEVPLVIASVMSPNLIGRYSRSATPAEMLPYVETPTVAIATFFPALLVVVVIGIEWVLHYILPRFLPGFVAMEILLFGAFFIALARGPSSFLLAVRKQIVAVAIYAICVLAAFGLNLWFVKLGWGLVGVAIATSLTYALLFALYVTYIFTFFFGRRLGAYARLYARLLLPFALSALVYVALRLGIPLDGHAPLADAARSLGRTAIYLALVTPFLIAFLRRHGLWEPLLRRARWETLRDRLRFPRRPR